MRELNTVGIDTPREHRQLRLLEGSIVDAHADLRVLSTHANPDFAMGGEALSAFGLAPLPSSALEPVFLLHPGDVSGVYRIAGPENSELLVLRLPGANTLAGGPEEHRRVYERGIFGVFAALAALELEGHGFERVASVVIGGNRGFDMQDVMSVIVRNAVRWLRRAQHTRQIDLVLYQSSHANEWARAMDSVLHRRAYDVANDPVVTALADELVGRLDARLLDDPQLREKVAVPLRGALHVDRRHELCVGRLSAPGRILAEYAVVCLEARRGVKKRSGSLYERIQRLESSRVEPWIAQHLHALRVYGNEAVHFKENERALDAQDLPGLLASLLRIVVYMNRPE